MGESHEEILARLRGQMSAIEHSARSSSRKSQDIIEEDDTAEDEACEDSSEEAAFQRIVKLASLNELASAKLRDRLVLEGFPVDAVESALQRAVSCGLVDDARYAEVLVRSRISQGRGRQGIELELDKLGIEFADIDKVFAEGGQDEVERAYAVLLRKPPHSKDARGACYRCLVRRGFSSEVSSRAARMWCEHFAHEEASR